MTHGNSLQEYAMCITVMVFPRMQNDMAVTKYLFVSFGFREYPAGDWVRHAKSDAKRGKKRIPSHFMSCNSVGLQSHKGRKNICDK